MKRQGLDPAHRFGKLQLRIMQLLWKQKLNARQITDALNAENGHDPVAHSTVQTLLRKLEEKRAVDHEVDDRTFIFHAVTKEQSAVRKAARDFLETLFGGSLPSLVSHLLAEENVSQEELDAIQKMIEQKKKTP